LVRCLSLLGTTQPQEAHEGWTDPRTCSLIAEWLLEQFPDLLMTVEAMIAEGYTLAIRLLSEETNLGGL
jgi:hypothetical protein